MLSSLNYDFEIENYLLDTQNNLVMIKNNTFPLCINYILLDSINNDIQLYLNISNRDLFGASEL